MSDAQHTEHEANHEGPIRTSKQLIGAVVAEFTAGAAGRETGLASRILEASFRTEVPKMFAALLLVSLTGIAIFLLFNALGRRLLGRWHDSETAQSERGTSR